MHQHPNPPTRSPEHALFRDVLLASTVAEALAHASAELLAESVAELGLAQARVGVGRQLIGYSQLANVAATTALREATAGDAVEEVAFRVARSLEAIAGGSAGIIEGSSR